MPQRIEEISEPPRNISQIYSHFGRRTQQQYVQTGEVGSSSVPQIDDDDARRLDEKATGKREIEEVILITESSGPSKKQKSYIVFPEEAERIEALTHDDEWYNDVLDFD